MDVFEKELLAVRPNLERFAEVFCRNITDSEDLVQETIAKALMGRKSFRLGTNLITWLYVIMRNHFMSQMRRRKFVDDRSPDNPCDHLPVRIVGPNQDDVVMLAQVLEAVRMLSDEQRLAIRLIGMEGFSYDEVASSMGVPVGTVKSRVRRARIRLAYALEAGYDHPLPSAHALEHAVST